MVRTLAAMKSRADTSPKERLIETALDLFRREGFHATGIDRLLAEAGVAKMTLYKHFKSKDALIEAVLRHHDEQWRHWFQTAVEAKTKSSKKRLVAVFDVLGEWFDSDNFVGCLFVAAAAEYADRKHPIHAIAAEHKALVRAYLAHLARAAGSADSEALGGQLAMLMEGAISAAHVRGDRRAARCARKTAKILAKQGGD